jgi:hypothetical protein
MLVAIGFIALLTGAIAERFLAGEVEEVEEEVAGEIEGVEASVLRELREVTERLQRLEARGSGPRARACVAHRAQSISQLHGGA